MSTIQRIIKAPAVDNLNSIKNIIQSLELIPIPLSFIDEGHLHELEKNGRILPQVHEAINEWKEQQDPLYYITARYNKAIEQMISQAPEQYLWLHRRWKSRPAFERAGEPVPKKMIRQLESLPWMTDEELARIVENSTTHVTT